MKDGLCEEMGTEAFAHPTAVVDQLPRPRSSHGERDGWWHPLQGLAREARLSAREMVHRRPIRERILNGPLRWLMQSPVESGGLWCASWFLLVSRFRDEAARRTAGVA